MAFWYRGKNKRRTNKLGRGRKGYLVNAYYDGKNECAVLEFLDPSTQTVFKWFDNTGHKSYLLTDADSSEVTKLLQYDPEFIEVKDIDKYDILNHRVKTVGKVLGTNPQAIGGSRYSSTPSFRQLLERNDHNVWEAWIRYHHNYIYDTGLNFMLPYVVSNEKITPITTHDENLKIKEVLDIITSNEDVDMTDALRHWIKLFETELPDVKKVAVDIEVEPDGKNVPDAEEAKKPLLMISFVTSDRGKIVIVFERDGVECPQFPIDAEVLSYSDEAAGLRAAFNIIEKYPVVLTYNGDHFDLRYMNNRALNLGVHRSNIPLYVPRKEMKCDVNNAIHIDLFKIFRNISLKNYAFKGQYKHHGLDDVAMALLGKGKIQLGGEDGFKDFSECSYEELARYCLNDAELTYDLATYDDNMVINLILVLSRMANLPIVDICRYRISTWIKSTFFTLFRERNILIPNEEELLAKGEIQTKATIEGKGYQGAIVRDPHPGVHFNVKTLDFASLYPSEIKERNISFETVNCGHSECVDNKVPYTTHHLCTKYRGISSEIVGSLRDARVYFYKPESKRKDIDKVQKAFYKVFEQSVKIYINGSYGVFGSPKFQLFTPPVGEIITAWSRYDMTRISDKAIDMGITVIYGDTDSIGLKNPSNEQIEELITWAHDELKLDLETDKTYRVGFFSERKKNYLGIFENGEPDIKGLVGMKSNTPPLIREAFDKVIDILCNVTNMDEVEEGKSIIVDISKEYYDRLRNKDFELEELSTDVTLGMSLDQYKVNSQHVKAAKIMVEQGMHVEPGEVIRFVKANNEEGVLPIDLSIASGLDGFMGSESDVKKSMKGLVNIDNYVDTLRTALVQVLDPLDIDFDVEVMGKKPQKTQVELGNYFPQG